MALSDLGDDMLPGARGEPVVRVGRRFLPVAAAVLPPFPDEGAVVDLLVPVGTPVHAVQSGRVVTAEASTVGEVVIRVDGDVRIHYRRLLPSSVTVVEGAAVEAGDVIGMVGAGAGDGPSALAFGAQHPDGSWAGVADLLVGLPDPMELFLQPPTAGSPDLVARVPSERVPARRRTKPTRQRGGSAPVEPEVAEPELVAPGAVDPGSGPPQLASEDPGASGGQPDEDDKTARVSGLAARRRRPERRR